MKYYPIKNLQSDTPELNDLLDSLKPQSTSSAEFDSMKQTLLGFMQSMRSDLHVEVEENYVDRVYRDSYYNYYDTKRLAYSRYCLRLSFFDKDFNKNVNLEEKSNIIDNYLGFVILRPLRFCIGRNVIKPEAKADTDLQKSKICRARIDTSCFGIKMQADGFPHASQDTETMTCAQTTIWTLLEYYGNKYSAYCPTTPTQIQRILETFSYERQLPSTGLNYYQISVALRSLGFGPKIYSRNTTAQFDNLLACYIESGIPVAVALQGTGIGHAVVCIGREHIDKNEVLSHVATLPSGKTVYDWNQTVASKRFVFNDDNFPNYQLASLATPCSNYHTIPGVDPNWLTSSIKQFIAPLYGKIYMEADAATELSNIIIEQCLPNVVNHVKRTFLTSGRTLREHISNIHSIDSNVRIALLQITLPKFVWVTELSTIDEFLNDQVSTLLLIDATGNSIINILGNVIFLLSERYLYRLDANTHLMTGSLINNLPPSFEAFPGNLQ